MSNTRPAIPNSLQRDLMLESGYRCAVCKATDPLQIEHIKEWSKVKKHEFANLIVLCANCHGRKKNTSNPRYINMASLKRIKENLMMLNGRYSDLEKRIIYLFSKELLDNPNPNLAVMLPANLYLLIQYLADDKIINVTIYNGVVA